MFKYRLVDCVWITIKHCNCNLERILPAGWLRQIGWPIKGQNLFNITIMMNNFLIRNQTPVLSADVIKLNCSLWKFTYWNCSSFTKIYSGWMIYWVGGLYQKLLSTLLSTKDQMKQLPHAWYELRNIWHYLSAYA